MYLVSFSRNDFGSQETCFFFGNLHVTNMSHVSCDDFPSFPHDIAYDNGVAFRILVLWPTM